MERESFKSRLGFLLVSAGCAIGIGNVWKFPYVAGANGGGVFVLFYLLFLMIMGVPILTMELAVGRSSRRSAVESYKALEKPGSKWHWHGWVCIIGCTLLMMMYPNVSGWMFGYFVKFATGTFNHITVDAVPQVFADMQGNVWELSAWTVIMLVATIAVVIIGLQKGLERINKVMMVCLFALILVLAVNSILMPGAREGLSFYLLPDFQRAKEVGIFNVMVAAMNQSFFTLSLGIGSMEIFGSYMSKDRTLAGEAVRICALDTFVAVTSGLIIFPACFSYNVAPDAGPDLIFITLPKVFMNMPMGNLWGALFFLFMVFACFSTLTAVAECLIAACMDSFGWSRKKSSTFWAILLLVSGLPSVFGFNIWSEVTIIRGMNIMFSEDFLVSNLLLPGGCLVYLLFCTTRWGWGFDKYLAEANTGKGLKLSPKLKPFFQFVLPVLILVILIYGLI